MAGRWIMACGVAAAVIAAPSVRASDEIDRAGLFRIAEENSPVLAIAREEIAAAEGRLRQAGLYPNPELELEADAVPLSPLESDAGMAKATLAQPIIVGGRRSAAIDRTRADVEAARARHEAERRALLLEVQRAQIEILFYSEWWSRHYDHLAMAEETLALVESAAASGRASAGEVARARAEVEETALGVTKIVAERIYAAQRLQVLLGGEWVAPERLAGGLREGLDPEVYQFDPAALIDGHPATRAAELGVEVAGHAIRQADAEAIPDVTLFARAAYDRVSEESFGGVGVRIPIPVWHRNQGAREEARAIGRQSSHAVTDVRVLLRQRLEEALQQINEFDTLASSYALDLAPAARRGFEAAREAFSAGGGSVVDLLDAQRAVIRAEDTGLYYLYQLNLAYASLAELRGWDLPD